MPLRFALVEARMLSVAGELDLATAEELTRRLDAIGQGDGDLTLEASGLSFVDSTGVRALLRVAERLQGRGRLILRSPTPAVRRVLRLMGLTRPALGLLVEDGAPPPEDRGSTEIRVFPADRAYLQEIRAFIRRQALADAFARHTDSLVLAVSEAAANAILHSGTPEIVVSWRPFPDRVEVEVRDEGIFRRALSPNEDGTKGRGILLMMSTMDQITITCGTDARPGTVVRMVKMHGGLDGEADGRDTRHRRQRLPAKQAWVASSGE
jgi:anti-anti-sigma factor